MQRHNSLVSLCFAIATLFGCANASPVQDGQATGTAAQALVFEHSAAELATLSTSKVLRLDLSNPQAVHVLNYARADALHNVLVQTSEEEAPLHALVKVGESGQIVLSGTPALVDAYLDGALAAELERGQTVNHGNLGLSVQALKKGPRCCDSCEDLGGGIGPLVCSGCGPCADP